MPQPLISVPIREVSPPPPPAARSDPGPAAKRLWLAAYLPQLPLAALAKCEQQPFVVVERDGAELRTVAANATALAAGVGIGARLLAALASCGSLGYCKRSTAREQKLLEALAAWAQRLTPVVSWVPFDALLLEIGGSLRLLGGLDAIKARLAEELTRRDLAFELAVAPTRLGALWLARHGGGDALDDAALRARLAALPITVTRWPTSVQSLLHGVGITTLGDCLRLSRDGLTLRCGKRVMRDLDRALGKQPDLTEQFVPRPWLSYEADFIAGLSEPAELVGAAEQLIDALAGELRKRQALVRKLEIVLRHRRGRSIRHVIELLDPSRDKARLTRLLLSRMEKLELSESVIAMRCRAEIEHPTQETNPSLFDASTPAAGLSFPELIELLRERIGAENVHGLSALADYRPERAWEARRDNDASTDAGRWPSHSSRPLWLLASPVALAGLEGIRLESGPERIEAGWWDGEEIRRDYYVARTTHESAWWIYRERGGGRWYLHGLFG
jgi:protein ImuB